MTTVIILEMRLILIGLLVVVSYKLLTGGINLDGLLYEDGCSGNYSPGRVQLLVVSVTFALFYLLKIMQKPSGFPEIPQEMLYLLGGGNFIYLGGKYRALFRKIECLK